MRRVHTWMAALALAAFAAAPALAQDKPRFGFGGGFGVSKLQLLSNKSVQDELKLTEDQVKKFTDLQEKQRANRIDFQNLSQEEVRAKMQERAKETEKALGEILKPEQLKRLNQISLQQRRGNALSDPEVQKTLGFTDEQKDKVVAIQKDGFAAMRDLVPQGQRPDEEALKKIQEFQKTQNTKLMDVLTADQKTKWKELTGDEFKGEIKPGFGIGRKPGKPPVE